MPWRSTVVPSSVPTSVHVAPEADSGSPAIERAGSPGRSPAQWRGCDDGTPPAHTAADNRAVRSTRAMIHWTTAGTPDAVERRGSFRRTGPIHGAQDPHLGASVPQTRSGEANPEVRSRASASRSGATSFWTRRRTVRTSRWIWRYSRADQRRNSGPVRNAGDQRRDVLGGSCRSMSAQTDARRAEAS